MLNKNIITLASLLAGLILSACGTGGDSRNNPHDDPVDPDTTPPSITGKSPRMGSVVSAISPPPIELTFSEALDMSGVNVDQLITISPAIDGSWRYDAETYTLVFTPAAGLALPANTSYTVKIDGQFRDLAQNRMGMMDSLNFATPTSYAIKVQVTPALPAGSSITLTNRIAYGGSFSSDNLILDDSGSSFTFNHKVFTGTTYKITMDGAPTNKFCLLRNNEGTLVASNAGDITVNLYCGDVMPVFDNGTTDSGMWTAYFRTDGSLCTAAHLGCVHGGEQRQILLSKLDPGLTSCADIPSEYGIGDALNAFHWQCQDEDRSGTPGPWLVSTALRDEVRLLDLINNDKKVEWKTNRVQLKSGDSIVHESAASLWWANPFTTLNTADASAAFLDNRYHVYVTDKQFNAFVFRDDHITLLNTRETYGFNDIVTSADRQSFIWVEQDAKGTTETPPSSGIRISNSAYPVIRHSTVTHINGHGIQLSNIRQARISHTQVFDAGGHGILLDGLYGTGSGVEEIHDVVSIGNGGDGIHLTSFEGVNVEQAWTGHNGGSGVYVSGAKKRLMGITSYSNKSHGVEIADANGAYVQGLSANHNGGDGIHIGSNSASVDAGTTTASISDSTLVYNQGGPIGLGERAGTGHRLDHVLASGNTSALPTSGSTLTWGADTVENGDVSYRGRVSLDGDAASIADDATIIHPQVTQNTGTPDANGGNNGHLLYLVGLQGGVTESLHRGWGQEASPEAPPAVGVCAAELFQTDNLCAIYDWSLASTSNTALNSRAQPDAEVDFNSGVLSNAVELAGDGDGLCETGEQCLYTPNTGAYQGHGALVEITPTTEVWATNNIRLFRYENNGH